MSRRSEVVTVVERLVRSGIFSASAVATLAAVCCNGCSMTTATVVRPWETTGDVVDAMLRAAGWDPARDLCPDCVAEREQIDAMRCPECRSPFEHFHECSRRRGTL